MNLIFLSGGGFGPLQPDPGLILWTTIIFLLFWFIAGKFGFKPIAEALKKREHDIQDSLDEAKKARQEMANLKAENEELLAQAREERTMILKEAKEVKENIISEAKQKAKEEAKKIVSEAKESIENQKMAAMIEIKNQTGQMALEIAEMVMRRELKGDAAQEKYVNELVDNIKLN